MKNSKLRTDFVCIATAGRTVDGRTIPSEHLYQIAKTYDPKKYTANMWREHQKYYNYGQVLEVKAEEVDGEVKLFARLAPSMDLIYLNKRGQALFTSMEYHPNFQGTGEAYLTGLGVTDTPASVGTTQLEFSNKKDDAIYGDFLPISFNQETETTEEEKVKKGFFAALKEYFTHEENNNYKQQKEEDDMSKEDLQALKSEIVTEVVNAVSEKFSAFSKQEQKETVEQTKVEETTATETQSGDYVTKEEYTKLNEKLDAVLSKFSAMSEEVTQEPEGVPAGTQSFTIHGDI